MCAVCQREGSKPALLHPHGPHGSHDSRIAIIHRPTQGDVLVVGTTTNVSWVLEIFEESTAVASDGSLGTSATGSLQSDLDIGTVRSPRWPYLGVSFCARFISEKLVGAAASLFLWKACFVCSPSSCLFALFAFFALLLGWANRDVSILQQRDCVCRGTLLSRERSVVLVVLAFGRSEDSIRCLGGRSMAQPLRAVPSISKGASAARSHMTEILSLLISASVCTCCQKRQNVPPPPSQNRLIAQIQQKKTPVHKFQERL